MRNKVLVIVMMMFLLVIGGCVRRWEEVKEYITAVNWTSDNNIVFVKEVITWECEEIPPFISEHSEVKRDEFYIYEVGFDGSGLKEVCYLWDRPGGIDGLSSAGEWIVFGDNIYREIWVMRRDGSGLEKVGEGLHPDFSPDASKIVYEKPDSGIWIMNRDGSNDHCIVPDADAKYPAWSPDDSLIGYGLITHIINLNGDSLFTFQGWWFRDWGPESSNCILVTDGYGVTSVINLVSGEVDTLKIFSFEEGNGEKWSPDGQYFIGWHGDWFVISADGSNKWYLKDLIE